jgi:drug/metabolite transporter (DMT)-like permease
VWTSAHRATTRRAAYGAWIAVCVLWGTTYLAIRIALETLPPLLMAGSRYIVAGTILVTLLKVQGERLAPRDSWPRLALLGLLLLGFGNGGIVWAEQTVPSGLAALLAAMTPFWMVGIDAAMPQGQRLTPLRIAGLIVGFVGIVLLVSPEPDVRSGRRLLGGVIAAEIACLGWAVGSTYARRRAAGENVLVAAAFEMLFGGVFLVTGGLLHQEWRMLSVTPRTFSAWAYLVVFGAVAGFSAYAYALKHLPIATVSLYAYVNPVIAVTLGTLVLGEPFSPRLVAAAAVVFVGIAMVRR